MRKRSRNDRSPRPVLLLLATALVAFLVGELLILTRTDGWRIPAARYLGLGDRARLTELIGERIRRGTGAAGVPRDSIVETVAAEGASRVRWRVGLRPEISAFQVNHAITRAVEASGAEVLSGRERTGKDGETVITLAVGVGERPTHELTIVRAPRGQETARTPHGGRIAVVLFGFADDLEQARAFFDLPVPFAVALAPGFPASAELFASAHERDREVILHLPLEPINYPQVNPGPGTLLVTMKPGRIAATLDRYLNQSSPVRAVANHMGSLATQDMTVMAAIYRELRRRGLPFVHVAPAPGSVCRSLAAELGVSYDQPTAVIDVEARADTPGALDRRWRALVKTADDRKPLLVFVRATPLTREWLPRALDPHRLGPVSVVPLGSLLRPQAL